MPTLSMKAIQDLDLPLTEIVSGRIGYIHDLFLTFPYEVRPDLPEGAQDLVVLMGKKNRKAGLQELAEYPGRVVVVFAPGDASIRHTYTGGRRGLPPNIVAAYATNNELADRRTLSVPLGVRINKVRTLQFVRQNHGGSKRGLLYGNFALNEEWYREDVAGTKHIRSRLVEQLRDEPWADLDISSEHRDTPEELVRYYSEIAGHRFALSPEGNGIDCYRTWEILYLGAIPIVMVSTETSAFTGLPILFTEDYSELSEDYLERRWNEMSRRTFEVERMLKSYYFLHFLTSVSSLREPRFVCWQVDDSPSWRFVKLLERSSHSGSGVMTETPRPPFTGRRDLAKHDDWHAFGPLRLEQLDEGLRIVAGEGSGSAVAEFPFETIAGGPFRLRGTVRPGGDSGASLTVAAREGPDVVATREIAAGPEANLDLPFVARSNRTVVSITATTTSSEATWQLSGLSLDADL